jgi:hypothetical protein
MAKKPAEPPKPIVWNVHKFASKAVWLGVVEAPDEAAAMERAAEEFKVAVNRRMAISDGPPQRRNHAPTISSTAGRIMWRYQPKRCGASRTARRSLALPLPIGGAAHVIPTP